MSISVVYTVEKNPRLEILTDGTMTTAKKWEQLTNQEQEKWEIQAKELIEGSYPLPIQITIDTLAEILYNKHNENKNN